MEFAAIPNRTLAEILSYGITSTVDIAKFRLIPPQWNKDVFPFALKSAEFIRNCYHNNKFINKLITFGEETYPTHFPNIAKLGISILRADGENEAGTIESLVVVDSGYEASLRLM